MPDRSPRNRRLKTQFVALNQQLLAFACVLAVAIAAASVMRLDIVAPGEDGGPDASQLSPAIRMGDAYVATKPVAPKVREVAAKTPPTPEQPEQPEKQTPSKDGLPLLDTSAAQKVTGYGTVGVTWDESDALEEDQVAFEVRSSTAGKWSAWEALEYHDEHGADGGEESGRTMRQGTEPSVVGDVDQVQFRVFSGIGRLPHGMRWVVIDPGQDQVVKQAPAIDTGALKGTKDAEKQDAKALAKSGISLSAMKTAPKPQIYSRAQWGADEKLREQSKPAYGTIQTGFVHHTVNANNYTAAQVPALLRSIYAYHTVSRGWRDIGYNFLVDRFGKIWEGRWGGVDKAVVGAHTLGYNEVSFAGSAIGNWDVAQPPQAVLTAFSKLMAWKLSMYDINANATGLRVKGKTLRAINGHRDVGSTACPGRYLYAKLGEIRTAAAKIQKDGTAPADPDPAPTSPPATPPTAPPSTMPVAADDLDARTNLVGNAWPDLVLRLKGTDQVKIVPTAGVLGFKDAVKTTSGWTGLDQVVAAGDVTGDGKGDLVVRNASTGVVSVRAGDGKGGFGKDVTATTALKKARWIAAAKDLDGDGKNDLLASDGADLLLLRGTGKGTFGKPVVLTKGWGTQRVVGAGDVNGDGKRDLVTVDGERKIQLLPGTTPGKVGAAKPIGSAPEGSRSLLAVSDMTGDGIKDYLFRGAGDDLVVVPGNGNGGVTRALDPYPVLGGLKSLAFGPVIGATDARTSLAVVGVDGSGLQVKPSNGRGTVMAAMGGLKVGDVRQIVGAGDWDGDGRGDLITRSADGDVLYLHRGDGRGGFAARVVLAKGMAKATSLSAMGDVTGDGKPDLVGKLTKDSGLAVWPGKGAKGLGSAIRPTPQVRSFNQIGTGTWSVSGGDARIKSSDGSFVPFAGDDATGKPGDTYDWVIGRGDANGDNLPDLIVREKSSGYLFLLPGTADGFGQRVFLAAGFAKYDLAG